MPLFSCLTYYLLNRKFLLLTQEEYPNPCDSELYFDIFNLMDLGEVVENYCSHHPVSATRQCHKATLWADPPLLNTGGETITFHFLILCCFMLFSFGLNSPMLVDLLKGHF
jgi:hypothetical protein